jgi:hypothetical protein
MPVLLTAPEIVIGSPDETAERKASPLSAGLELFIKAISSLKAYFIRKAREQGDRPNIGGKTAAPEH